MFQTLCQDARIAYRMSGRGPAVLLLHCTGGSSGQWKQMTQALEPDHQVIAVDLHGHGDSDSWPGHRALTLADEAAAALAALDSVAGPVHVVGHSYGGAVALRLALDHPERVKSLTLIEPVSFHLLRGRGDSDRDLFMEIGRVGLAISRAAGNGDYHSGLARFVDFWNQPGAWAAMPPARQAQLTRQIGAVALNFWATLTDQSVATDLADIAVPTQVLAGEASPKVTRRIAQLVAVSIPDARLHCIEGAGHMLPLTHPESAQQAVRTLIRRAEARQPTPTLPLAA